MTGVRYFSEKLNAVTVRSNAWRTEVGLSDDDGMVAVRAPARLHHVALRGAGGLAGAGAQPLHVHHHARHFGHGRVANVLLHQRKAGAAGGRHGLQPAHRGADAGGQAGNLVFHLDELAAHLGQLAREHLGDFGGGRDGIARVEAAAGRQRPPADGFVALHQFDSHVATSSTTADRSR